MLNNNFSKLVKLYQEYKAKRRNKYLIAFFSFLLVIAGAYLWFTNPKQKIPVKTVQANTTVQPVQKADTTAAQAPQKVNPPIQKTAVATPKTEPMPNQVQTRTPKKTRRSDETFQLKVTQRKSLYNLLLDYKNHKGYITAIKVAEFYIHEKDYDKAVKWAVEASKMDPSQAQSWIIYAKAKKALGNVDVAKKALGIYLKHNYSQSAQNLLDSL